MTPDVSIIVLTHNHPDVFSRLFESLPMTDGIAHEVVVVDNGSDAECRPLLEAFRTAGTITTLVFEPINHFFSEGNNIGVRYSNPDSTYILLLNSDVEILRPDWLLKQVEWMEGVPEILAYTWCRKPTVPAPGPRDIVSIGWSWDGDVPGYARPEGWCCMLRRSIWRDISPDFPFHSGFEEMVAGAIRDGARCGVLCQYAKYLTHYEGGCNTASIAHKIINTRVPDIAGWFRGVPPSDTLDFTLGPDEHESYIEW